MVTAMPALFAYAPPWAWASSCGALALIYFLAWPKRKANGLGRLRYFVVRWFHGLVWVLLGVSLALHSVEDERQLARTAAKALAVLALLVYGVFVYSAYGPRRANPPGPGDDGVTGPRAR
jgi:hypothetical protein